MTLYPSILIQILITVAAVCGAYVPAGLTGMFSLGQVVLMAVGSYASGILMVKCGFPFQLVCILAMLTAVMIGYPVGFPTVRPRRDYISLATLGSGKAITAPLNRVTKLAGGASGFIGIPRKTAFLPILVSAITAIAIVSWFKTSKYDRQCITVRSDELAVRAMGINVPKIKMGVFLSSVAVTAFSGCPYAFFTVYVDPTILDQKKSADQVIMVFFGGVNSLVGSVVGAFILNGLPEMPRSLDQYRSVTYAILVLLIINFESSGIFGEWGLSPRDPKILGEELTKRSRKEEKTDGAA